MKRKNALSLSLVVRCLCSALWLCVFPSFGCGGEISDPDVGGDDNTLATKVAPQTILDFENLTPEQQATLAACEQVTGERSFAGCPVPVLCSGLDPNDTLPLQVTFAPLTTGCTWTEKTELDGPDDDSNLRQAPKRVQARFEQVLDLAPMLAVPEGEAAVFCSIDIGVQSLRQDGLFRYDDDLLFIFGGESATSGLVGGALLATRNQAVVAATLAPVAEFSDISWPLYRWSNVATNRTTQNNPVLHCLGYESLDAEAPECGMPETEQSGAFFLNLSDDTAGLLGLRAALNGNYNLSVVMTGDDDPPIDCKHDGFTATVNVGYISLPKKTIQLLKPVLI